MTWNRIALICFALAAVQVAVTLYASHASSRQYPEDVVRRYFSADYLSRAARYRQDRLAGQRVTLPVEVALPLLFVFAGPLVLLARRLDGGRAPFGQGLLLMGAFVLFTSLLSLPFQYRYGHLLERKFGFSNQSALSYLGDYAKGVALGLLLTAVVTALFIALYRALPRAWPWVTWASLAALIVFLTLIFPWVVEPLFFDFHDLPAGELRARIETLARDHGIRIERILVMKASAKTNRTNAYVSGLWGSHRVVLFDTLLQRHSTDEVMSVVAHELGHSVKNHVAMGMALSIGGLGLGLLLAVLLLPWLAARMPVPVPPGGLGPLLPLVLVLLSLGGFFGGPLASAISRAMEAQADHFALEVTRDRAAAIAVEKKLTEDNLADPNPRWLSQLWFASHPDPISRIRAAEAWPEEGP